MKAEYLPIYERRLRGALTGPQRGPLGRQPGPVSAGITRWPSRSAGAEDYLAGIDACCYCQWRGVDVWKGDEPVTKARLVSSQATSAWPFLSLPEGPLLLLSPHLDDAALSAGDLLSRHP